MKETKRESPSAQKFNHKQTKPFIQITTRNCYLCDAKSIEIEKDEAGGTWINARDIDQSIFGTRHGLHRGGVPRSCRATSTRVRMLLIHHSVRQHCHIRSHISLSLTHSKTIQKRSKVSMQARRERSSLSKEIIRAPHGRISLWCWWTLKKMQLVAMSRPWSGTLQGKEWAFFVCTWSQIWCLCNHVQGGRIRNFAFCD